MKKSTKITIAATTSALVGTLIYLSDQAAKKISKSERYNHVELDGFKEVRIKNQKGQMITGYFSNQHASTTMIILHSLTTCAVDMLNYYEYFKNRIDCNFLLVDLSGYGKSEGDHISLDDSYQDDLISWIDYLKRSNTTNIIMYGKQLGANVILNSLKQIKYYDEIKCVISDGATVTNEQMIQDEVNQMYPVLHIIIGLITKLIMKYKYHIPFKHLAILDNLKDYDRPILFIQSKKDPLVKFKRIFNIYNAKKDQKELILLKDEAYLFEYEDVNAPYYHAMFDFIQKQL